MRYDFAITGLSEFHPQWVFPKEEGRNIDAGDPVVQNLLFSIGLVELVSYWKITCSPPVSYTHLDVYKRQIWTLTGMSSD